MSKTQPIPDCKALTVPAGQTPVKSLTPTTLKMEFIATDALAMANSTDQMRDRPFPSRTSWTVRAAKRLFGFGRKCPLDADGLMLEAVRRVPSGQWGDGAFRPGLEKFCSSVNQERSLDGLGHFLVRRFARQRLEDRLRIGLFLDRYPEVLSRPVPQPVMITGQPRSGTTLIHRLIALDPQFRAPRTWEVFNPVPPPVPGNSADPRIRRMKWDLRILDWVAPGFAAAHPMAADSPEECNLLLDRTFNQPVSCVFLDIPEYQEWLLARSTSELETDYRFYKKQLQILQWRYASVRWLLKAPCHALYLPAVCRVFPDIKIIVASRRSESSVASLCSLAARMRSALCHSEDPVRLGTRLLDYLATGLMRLEEARRLLGSQQFFDYRYEDLEQNPLQIVKQIYAFIGAELSPQIARSMRTYLTAARSGIHAQHRYSLEQFGLTRDRIQRKLSV